MSDKTANSFDFESLPVTISYVCETQRDDCKCDQWRVGFKHPNGFWQTDYFTGLGLRAKPKKGFPRDTPKPIKPAITDVMHALLSDAEAIDQSFKDWCDNYAYSDDSLKAFDTYRQCCEIGLQLSKVFSRAEIAKMREALQDY